MHFFSLEINSFLHVHFDTSIHRTQDREHRANRLILLLIRKLRGNPHWFDEACVALDKAGIPAVQEVRGTQIAFLCFIIDNDTHTLCFSWSFTEALVTRRCPEDVLSTGTSTYQTCPSELGGSINSGFQSLGSFKRLQINRDFEASQPPPMCK